MSLNWNLLTRQSRYFVNERDQVRKISDPEQEFQFKINKHPRWNEAQREAMSGKHSLTCVLQNRKKKGGNFEY